MKYCLIDYLKLKDRSIIRHIKIMPYYRPQQKRIINTYISEGLESLIDSHNMYRRDRYYKQG
jgi:hypothetical protein